MFAYLERPQFVLIDSKGTIIDHQKFMPTTAYSLSGETIFKLGKFICLKDKVTKEKIVLKFSNGIVYIYEKPLCDFKKN